MGKFDGKTVLVTGGNRNTGLYITEKFVREGAKVFMCGSTPESTAKGEALLHDMGVRGFRAVPCDVSDIRQVTDLFDIIEREALSIVNGLI